MKYIHSLDYPTDGTTQQEVGYRISDSLSDNPNIKKSDNPLPVRALFLRVMKSENKVSESCNYYALAGYLNENSNNNISIFHYNT